ncbi:hypothetical protein [Morganella morganii]|uniref:hypothetical protein n=1 Tax=Morganella morganii TaxID=582 RepID=UPI000664DD41|nr:hypothetical protein [Morganella morganii]
MVKVINWIDKNADIRMLRFYVRFIMVQSQNYYGFPKLTQKLPDIFHSKNLLKQEINHYFSAIESSEKRQAESEKAERLYHKNILSISLIEWLKKDKEACALIWGLLHLGSDPFLVLQNIHDTAFNHQIINTTFPTSHEERFSLIVIYLDFLYFDEFDPPKSEYNDFLKRQWLQLSDGVKPFKWLNETSTEGIEWAWQYLVDYHKSEHFDAGRMGIDSLQYFNPINPEEKYLAIYSVLKLWNSHHFEKKNADK